MHAWIALLGGITLLFINITCTFEDKMQCPYKLHGFADKCVGNCKPLEKIFGYSGLTHSKSKYSSKNVLGAYVVVKLDDLVRDGNAAIKFLASQARSKMNKNLPERLNRFITTANQKIADAEKSDLELDQYLYAIGKMGEQIFNLATPIGSSYDKAFVMEAGRVSAELMVMDDMSKDLSQDMKSGKYNPLKETQTHSKFSKLYVNAQNRLEGMMNRIGIERTIPINLTSWGDFLGECFGALCRGCYGELPEKYQNIIAGVCCSICCICCIGVIVCMILNP